MSDPQTTPQPGNFSPCPGWRFIFDEYGAAHHVPDKELLYEMCRLYYKLPTDSVEKGK